MKKRERNTTTTETVTTERRSLLVRFWQVLAAAAGLELCWLATSLLRARANRRAGTQSGTNYLEAGTIDQFKPGDVKAVPRGGFYLVCLEDGSFLALSKTCTHLGCSVPWNQEEEKFICPCHGSSFDRNGVVLTPPAVRPLDYYPVKIENGLIRVDVASPKKRESFNASQAMRS